MPEMTVSVRWPDGEVQQCYSPSLVMHDHLAVGESYTVDQFADRATTALGIAAERVRARFGFACTSAAASADAISVKATEFRGSENVEILAMEPPLPVQSPAPVARHQSS